MACIQICMTFSRTQKKDECLFINTVKANGVQMECFGPHWFCCEIGPKQSAHNDLIEIRSTVIIFLTVQS